MAVLFSGIPRVRLLEAPTPLEKLPNVGQALGHHGIYVKRDDLMPLGQGGNKVRCLEFWLGDACRQNADLLLVAGAAVSNQCRLAAAAAAKLGLRCIILYSSPPPASFTGNALLTKIMAAETIFLGEMAEQDRWLAVRRYAADLRRQGHRPYIIGEDPVGGALGYVNAALELINQAERRNIDLRHVFVCGSEGPTEAGLLYGLSLFGSAFKLHIISVEYPVPRLRGLIENIRSGLCEKLALTPPGTVDDVAVFYDDYLGEGYARSTAASLAAVRLLASREALFVEKTYNSKVFAGMFDLITRGAIRPDETVCAVNTGGTPALFAQGDDY